LRRNPLPSSSGENTITRAERRYLTFKPYWLRDAPPV
jgi:hypothetical protein